MLIRIRFPNRLVHVMAQGKKEEAEELKKKVAGKCRTSRELYLKKKKK